MMRVAVIGNSHVQALAAGEALVPGFAGHVRTTYFGASADRMGQLEPRDGALVPATEDLRARIVRSSGGAERVVAADYDRFMLVGMDLSLHPVMNLYLTHALAEHLRPGLQPISRAAFARAVEGLLREAQSFAVLRALRSITDAPVDLVAAPLPHPRIADPAMARGRWAHPWVGFLHEAYGEALAHIAAADDVRILTQPAQTIAAPAFTRADFCLADEAHNLHHANDAYGAAFWSAWLAATPEDLDRAA